MGERGRYDRDAGLLRLASDLSTGDSHGIDICTDNDRGSGNDDPVNTGSSNYSGSNISSTTGAISNGRHLQWPFAQTPSGTMPLLPSFPNVFPSATITIGPAETAAAVTTSATISTTVKAEEATISGAVSTAAKNAETPNPRKRSLSQFQFQSQFGLQPAPLSSTNAASHHEAQMDQSSRTFSGRLGARDSESSIRLASDQEPLPTTMQNSMPSGSAFGAARQPGRTASFEGAQIIVDASRSSDTTAAGAVAAAAVSSSRSRYYDPARDLSSAPLSNITLQSSSSPAASPATSNTWYSGDAAFADGKNTSEPATAAAAPVQQKTRTRSGPDPLPHVESRFILEILEHPTAARASTYGDRDRRVINPPPVLKLSLKDYDPSSEADRKLITWPYNIVHCTLWRTPELDSEISECVEVTAFDVKARRREGGLMGSLVANPIVIESPAEQFDDHAGKGPTSYYVFHDLSCRTTGLYRLRFELTHIGEDFFRPGAVSPTVAYAWSTAFEVYSAKDFPGVRPSSRLLIYLKNKGVNVTIKKGGSNDAMAGRRHRAGLLSDDDSLNSADHEGQKPRGQGLQRDAPKAENVSTNPQLFEWSDPGG